MLGKYDESDGEELMELVHEHVVYSVLKALLNNGILEERFPTLSSFDSLFLLRQTGFVVCSLGQNL